MSIADDGEVLVRGPSVFKRILEQAEGNPGRLRGWLVQDWRHRQFDADGFLSITDRKKDLIKTSGGKFIAPQPIESSLKHNALVGEAVVIGDRRKFPAALIAPSFTALEAWAKSNGVSSSSRKTLVESPQVQRLYENIVETVNQNLARFEQLKKVLIVAEEFSADNGALTASMKLRRRAVLDRYRKEIDDMYDKAEREVR